MHIEVSTSPANIVLKGGFMSEYNIGRDYQELRSRVERLEKQFEQLGLLVTAPKAGVTSVHRLSAGVDRQKPPLR